MLCPFCHAPNRDDATTCGSCARPQHPMVRHASPAPVHALPLKTPLHHGTYMVHEPLGQGGWGITYLGGDLQLKRYVAIKEFFPLGAARDGCCVVAGGPLGPTEFAAAREKFLLEAQNLARYHHPHIVSVYAVFEENETAYMVMEFLRGQTLRELVEERGALPEREAITYLEQVGEAVEAIHAGGCIHRDITPSNCLVTPGAGGAPARIVVVDFGLSRQMQSAGLGTRPFSGQRLGTSGYAAPEQYLRDGVQGAFTDIYALSAMLYHLLTGQDPAQALERTMGAELPPPHKLNSDVSPQVSEAVVAGMHLEAASRPQSVREFLDSIVIALRTPGSAGRAAHGVRSMTAPPPLPDDAGDFDRIFGSTTGSAPLPVPGGPTPTPSGLPPAAGSPANQHAAGLHAAPPAVVAPKNDTRRIMRAFLLDRMIILGALGALLGLARGYSMGGMHWPGQALLGLALGALLGVPLGLVAGWRTCRQPAAKVLSNH